MQYFRSGIEEKPNRLSQINEGCAIDSRKPPHNENGRGGDTSPLLALVAFVLFGVLGSMNANHRGADQRNRGQQKHHVFRDPIVWATVVIAIATACGVGVGIAQWCALTSTDDNARRALVDVQRAFIVFGQKVQATGIEDATDVETEIENSGGTQTKSLDFIISQGFMPGDTFRNIGAGYPITSEDPDELFARYKERIAKAPTLMGTLAQYGVVIGPKQTVPAKHEVVVARAFEKQNLGPSFVYGIAHCWDIFAKTADASTMHVTKFCRLISQGQLDGKPAPRSELCPYWNCADDECKEDKKRYDVRVSAAEAARNAAASPRP